MSRSRLPEASFDGNGSAAIGGGGPPPGRGVRHISQLRAPSTFSYVHAEQDQGIGLVEIGLVESLVLVDYAGLSRML
jgi:hypothetical protein